MRVLIVGGGIAGLTLAALLRQRGIGPVVVEKRHSLSKAGYALGLWPLGGRVLKALGLEQKLQDASVPLKRYCIADSRGRLIHMHPVGLLGEAYGLIRMVQRGELIQLLGGVAGKDVRLGVTAGLISQDAASVNVVLSDGTAAEFDLVVGCDGIHSRVRTLIFDGVEPRSTGWSGWGWWVDPTLSRSDTMTEYWEPGKWFCAIYPAKNALCAVVGSPLEDQGGKDDGTRLDTMRKRLGAMEGFFPKLNDSFRVDPGVFYDTFYSLRINSWCRGRVALLGDASSAYFPFGGLGLGASMAMEAAAVFADEMSGAEGATVPEALQAYERRRRPRVEAFENAAHATEEIMLRPGGSTEGTALVLQHQRKMFRQFRNMLDSPI